MKFSSYLVGGALGLGLAYYLFKLKPVNTANAAAAGTALSDSPKGILPAWA